MPLIAPYPLPEPLQQRYLGHGDALRVIQALFPDRNIYKRKSTEDGKDTNFLEEDRLGEPLSCTEFLKKWMNFTQRTVRGGFLTQNCGTEGTCRGANFATPSFASLAYFLMAEDTKEALKTEWKSPFCKRHLHV